jgi:fermentation-respiration switch protein FrsA (DUF1100 family)
VALGNGAADFRAAVDISGRKRAFGTVGVLALAQAFADGSFGGYAGYEAAAASIIYVLASGYKESAGVASAEAATLAMAVGPAAPLGLEVIRLSCPLARAVRYCCPIERTVRAFCPITRDIRLSTPVVETTPWS